MKTITCRQRGGPCDLAHTADTADEIIQAQDRHLKATVAGNDTTHQEAAEAMKGRWRNPLKGMGWYRATKKAFAEIPEN